MGVRVSYNAQLFNTIFLMITLIYMSILGGVISSSLTLNALQVGTGIQGLNDLPGVSLYFVYTY